MPDLQAPTAFRAIVNAHFRLDPPADLPPMIGVLNATTEWLFAYPGRLSTTTSGADRLLDQSREELAATIWREVVGRRRPAGRIAALADRARAPRDLRGDA